MSLNIKNPDAHRLAQELSELTGESMATAVTTAVRERLARVRRQDMPRLSEKLLAIGRDAAARLDEATRTVDHGDLLYGDDGLPR